MKSKSKNKNINIKSLILRIAIIIFAIPVLIVPFLKIYFCQRGNGSIDIAGEPFGLFSDTSFLNALFKTLGGNFSSTIMTITDILIVSTAVIGLIVLILTILSFIMNKKIINKMLKIFGIILIAITIIAFISMTLTTIINLYTLPNTENYIGIALQSSSFILISGIVSGIFALLSVKK